MIPNDFVAIDELGIEIPEYGRLHDPQVGEVEVEGTTTDEWLEIRTHPGGELRRELVENLGFTASPF